MVEYSKVSVKLSDRQLNNWNCCHKENRNNSENKFKNVWWNWSASWIVTDNKTEKKLRNVLNNNMSTEVKLSKAQISKIIQTGGVLG